MVNKTLEEIQNFYLKHSNAETAAFLGVSKSQMLRILNKLHIEKKIPFKKHPPVRKTLEDLLKKIDKTAFCTDCKTMLQTQLCDKYNITVRQLNYLKAEFNIGFRIDYSARRGIDRQEFESYYRQHTLADTAIHFNLKTPTNVKNLLRQYNIVPDKRLKESVVEAAERIDKSELESYYKTHTLQETQEHFDCKILQHLLKYYNIEKKTKMHETFQSVIARIDADAFKADFMSLNIYELFKKYDIAYTMYRKLLQYYNLGYKPGIFTFNDTSLSKCEDDLYTFLSTLIAANQIVRHDRNILDGQELDFYIPTKKIGIEFNGTYWHSDLKKEKNYHFNKSKLAESHGIRLIHIWEYEWLNPSQQQKIKQMLSIAFNSAHEKIYARKCVIRIISNKEAKQFNEKTHLQGHRNAKITYGLFYKNKLVQLMSFSKTKYNRNLKDENSWEIIRGCPGSNNIVIGGVSKLLSHFIHDNTPNKVFSYCDFNKFDGRSYEAAGMHFIGYTGPDLKYLLQDGTIVNRNPKNYKYNNEHCKLRLFGAGSKKFELILSDERK